MSNQRPKPFTKELQPMVDALWAYTDATIKKYQDSKRKKDK